MPAPPHATQTPERVVRVAVNIEHPQNSEFRKVTSKVPLFGHLPGLHAEGGRSFSPPRPNSGLSPHVPRDLAATLTGELQVDVRLSIDKHGMVTNTEVLRGGGTQFASLAANNAGAASWEPAYDGDHRVASDVIVHYMFMPAFVTQQ
jgi:hypothetical protein